MTPEQQAAQFMRSIERRIKAIEDEAGRQKTGALAGGPYTSFKINSQGLITWAGAGGGGSGASVMSYALLHPTGDAPVGALAGGGAITPDYSYLYTYVATPNDGSNYWTVQVVGYEPSPGVSAGTIADIDTSADTAGAWTDHSALPVAGTTYPIVIAQISKTGAPGDLSLAGAVTYAGSGGGGGSTQYGAGQITGGTSYSASSYTLLVYSPTGFASGVYTAPATGKYLYTLYFRAASASWTAGDELRIYEDINGTARIVELFTIQASGTMYAEATASFIVPLSAGDGISWYIYHTRSSGSIQVDLTFVTILGWT